jgi:hypothetical protein
MTGLCARPPDSASRICVLGLRLLRFRIVLPIGLCLIFLHPSDAQASNVDPNIVKRYILPGQYAVFVRRTGKWVIRYPLTDLPGSANKTSCQKLCELLNIK